MKLEELVPPLDLCKKIPNGAFADSALVWNTTVCDEDDGEIVGVHERDDCDSWMRINQIPAPTLAEIMDALRTVVVTHFVDISVWNHTANEWGTHLYDHSLIRNKSQFDRNPATAALKLWLELNERKND